MEQYDVAVIGAGPGGYPAAIRAAQLGAKTVIIEREWLGGTCLNCGCIPTKTLIAGAERYQQVLEAASLGVQVNGDVSFDYSKMSERKEGVVSTLRNGIAGLLKANGIMVIDGAASFESRNRLAVKTEDGSVSRVKANRIIIATGSTSAMPGFIPKHKRVIESRAFLELKELPETMTVLGGGYIGCELACMAAALGVKVTIVELLEDVLLLLDKDVRQVVKKKMKALGINIMTGHALESIEANDKEVRGTVNGEVVASDMLLAAVGRIPVTDGLRIDRAGLCADEKGYIPVDATNRTSVAGIYAIGDVNGGMQLAHAATSQGVIAAEDACGERPRQNESLIPGVIFTMPEVAVVGLTEAEANDQGLEVEKGKFYFKGLGKALASEDSEGFVKWIADAQTGQLIGAQAVGPHATDLIAEATLAIRSELTAEEVGNTVHAHPTFAEIWMEAAHALHGTCIHAPPARK